MSLVAVKPSTQKFFYSFFMYYVYVLQNKNSTGLYYGYTERLKERIKEHNKNTNQWNLVYYEMYKSKKDALDRERKLKQYGQTRTKLKQRISNSIKNF